MLCEDCDAYENDHHGLKEYDHCMRMMRMRMIIDHLDAQVTVVLPHSWGRAACQPGRRVVTR